MISLRDDLNDLQMCQDTGLANSEMLKSAETALAEFRLLFKEGSDTIVNDHGLTSDNLYHLDTIAKGLSTSLEEAKIARNAETLKPILNHLSGRAGFFNKIIAEIRKGLEGFGTPRRV
jgi:hypothetical protein